MLSWLRRFVDYDSPVFGALSFLPPNAWSAMTVVCSAAAAWFYAQGRFPLGGALVLLSGLTDTIDGGVARHTGRTSRFGAIWDATMDRIGEGLIYAGLSLRYPIAMAALVTSYLVSYVRAKDDRARAGIAERTDRLALLALASFIGLTGAALWIITAAAAVTVVMRLEQTRKLLDT